MNENKEKEFDVEFTRGQHHYQSGKKKEDGLLTPAARAGWEAEKFHHEKKVKKAESN